MTPFVEVDSSLSLSRGRRAGGRCSRWPGRSASRRAGAVLIGLALLSGGRAEGDPETRSALTELVFDAAAASGAESPSILACEALWIEYWVKRALGLPCTQPNC